MRPNGHVTREIYQDLLQMMAKDASFTAIRRHSFHVPSCHRHCTLSF